MTGRRTAFRPLGALLLALLAAQIFARGQRANPRSVTILHTNDLHATLQPLPDGSGGFAALATAIKQERLRSPASLHLNAGDFVQGSPVSTLFRGLPILELANALRIDVAAIGNHEFDYGWQRFRDFQKAA